jgi:hypothetical protein
VSLATQQRLRQSGWLALLRNPIASVKRSVRGKLVGIVLLTTMLVLLVSGTAMLMHDLSVYRSSWASDVASEAAVLASAAAPALAFDDREAAERLLSCTRKIIVFTHSTACRMRTPYRIGLPRDRTG